MMTVKELKELLNKANDNEMVFFIEAYTDRDGWNATREARGIVGIKTKECTEEEKKQYKWFGY